MAQGTGGLTSQFVMRSCRCSPDHTFGYFPPHNIIMWQNIESQRYTSTSSSNQSLEWSASGDTSRLSKYEKSCVFFYRWYVLLDFLEAIKVYETGRACEMHMGTNLLWQFRWIESALRNNLVSKYRLRERQMTSFSSWQFPRLQMLSYTEARLSSFEWSIRCREVWQPHVTSWRLTARHKRHILGVISVIISREYSICRGVIPGALTCRWHVSSRRPKTSCGHYDIS